MFGTPRPRIRTDVAAIAASARRSSSTSTSSNSTTWTTASQSAHNAGDGFTSRPSPWTPQSVKENESPKTEAPTTHPSGTCAHFASTTASMKEEAKPELAQVFCKGHEEYQALMKRMNESLPWTPYTSSTLGYMDDEGIKRWSEFASLIKRQAPDIFVSLLHESERSAHV